MKSVFSKISPWLWVSLFLTCIIVFTIIFFIHAGNFNTAFITAVSSVVVGSSSFIVALLKYNNKFKEQLLEQDNKLEKAIHDIDKDTTIRISKMYEMLLNKQMEFSNKTTDFLCDTFIKIETNIHGVLNEIRDTKTNLTGKIEDVKRSVDQVTNDVQKLQKSSERIEAVKTKQESWARELEKDWDGCKARIQNIDDKELLNGALIIKDLFVDYANDVLSWNLYTESESDKSILINRIVERFDSFNISLKAQLPQMINNKDFLEEYYKQNKNNIVSFKLKVEKGFKENIINNVSKNFFNYSSQYLNETLNTFACAYVKVNGIKDVNTRCN